MRRPSHRWANTGRRNAATADMNARNLQSKATKRQRDLEDEAVRGGLIVRDRQQIKQLLLQVQFAFETAERALTNRA